MVIQHNIASMAASRSFGTTTIKQRKNAERLSSGYKINRAADNAAGLSISEKMRRQIRGLDRGSVNSDDGISLSQVAEGALGEVHDMLHRLEELAVQAANGTNSLIDRYSIQDEVDQITKEIDRVSESTKFNETYLLKGGTGHRTQYLNIHSAGLDGIVANSTNGVGHGTFTMDRLHESDEIMIAGRTYTIGTGKADVQSLINDVGEAGDKVVVNDALTFHIIEQNGSAPCMQATWIANRINNSTSDVKVGDNEHYVLRNGSAIAEYPGTVSAAMNNNTQNVSVTSSTGTTTNYQLLNGGYRAEYATNIAASFDSTMRSITYGGTTYVMNTANGYRATDINTINSRIDYATNVTYGGTTYQLSSGGYEAETASNVANDIAVGSSVTIYDSYGSPTYYTVVNDADVDAATNRVSLSYLQGVVNGLATSTRINVDGARYNIQSYNRASVKSGITNDVEVNVDGSKYLAKTGSNYKSVDDLKGIVNALALGTNVSITNSSGNTSNYTVRDYNLNTVKGIVAGSYAGAMDFATTSVTVDGNSYSLRPYNANSVKNRVAGFDEYVDGQITGTIIEVDGSQYTAETYFYRQKICTAYGEDQETNVQTPGAQDDDIFQDGDTVLFHEKTYTLMKDSNKDGYDDVDHFIVTEGRAYKIIAKEIEVASSIGATDSRAVVRDKNNVDIIDNVTMAADFLRDPNNDDSQVVFEIDRGTVMTAKELHVNIHAGTDADMTNKIGIDIRAINSASLGIKYLNVTDKTGINATYALDAISDAIQEVSRQRSLLGALSNRMEHTIRNLDNVVENTSSAESRLRDTDMAEEMVDYSKNNVLAQAGQAMITQANQTPQGVMSLLQ